MKHLNNNKKQTKYIIKFIFNNSPNKTVKTSVFKVHCLYFKYYLYCRFIFKYIPYIL